MVRIIIIMVVALITFVLIFLIVEKFFPKMQLSFHPSLPTLSIEKGVNQVLDNTKDSVLRQAVNVVDNVDNSIKTSVAENSGGGAVVLGSQNQTQTQNSGPQDITVVDFLTRNNLNLYLLKDTQYYLQFENFPANFCLFVDVTKYPIKNGDIVNLEFTQTGTFPLRVNFCDTNGANLGQVTVQ